MSEDPREYLTERERRQAKGVTWWAIAFMVIVMAGVVAAAWSEILDLVNMYRGR